jgi:CheY-like chemotaxis protein
MTFASSDWRADRSEDVPQPRVLVCDDEKVVRGVVHHVCEALGFQVVGEAGLALEALVMADIVHPHVIVLDVSLPGMNGVDVIPSLKARCPDAVIIVFSAFDALRDEALAAGAFDVVDKAGMNGLAPLEDCLRVVGDLLTTSV